MLSSKDLVFFFRWCAVSQRISQQEWLVELRKRKLTLIWFWGKSQNSANPGESLGSNFWHLQISAAQFLIWYDKGGKYSNNYFISIWKVIQIFGLSPSENNYFSGWRFGSSNLNIRLWPCAVNFSAFFRYFSSSTLYSSNLCLNLT